MNDEPRNEPVCKLLHPFLDNIITPECIPIEDYIRLHADQNKIIRYNGLDEIAWLSEYIPNPNTLSKLDLKKGRYILMRSEPSQASYFINKLKPDETQISKILPSIYREFPNHKYLLLVRSEKQEFFLGKQLKQLKADNIVITQYLPNILDLCFYGALIVSGGGTIVRESSLMNVPSIEFFPGDSAPQEKFLIENGFPLEHIRSTEEIIKKSIEILSQGPQSDRFKLSSFKERIRQFENPNEICFNFVKSKLNNIK
jgi:predicted glycosyltransferase